MKKEEAEKILIEYDQINNPEHAGGRDEAWRRHAAAKAKIIAALTAEPTPAMSFDDFVPWMDKLIEHYQHGEIDMAALYDRMNHSADASKMGEEMPPLRWRALADGSERLFVSEVFIGEVSPANSYHVPCLCVQGNCETKANARSRVAGHARELWRRIHGKSR
jgi:hypothetical protein